MSYQVSVLYNHDVKTVEFVTTSRTEAEYYLHDLKQDFAEESHDFKAIIIEKNGVEVKRFTKPTEEDFLHEL
jgi:hypothetical protein